MPLPTIIAPSRRTSVKIAVVPPPSAMRMPISRVRCVTWYTSTPYTPTAARNTATSEKASASTIGVLRFASDASRRSSIVFAS